MLRSPRARILAGLVVACLAAGGAAVGVAVSRKDAAPPITATTHDHLDGPAALDGATFIDMMVPHHELAIRMARIAQRRTHREAMRALAGGIIAEQTWEVRLMRQIRQKLYGAPSGAPLDLTKGQLAQMGMDVDLGQLASAKDSDVAFLRAMIPHHAGAVVMAQRVLLGNPPPELARVARLVIDAQSFEIGEMENYLRVWTGSEANQAGAAPPVPSRPAIP